MKYCLVTQRIEKVLPDVPGPEDEVSGKVRFAPSISYGGSFQVETEDGMATVPAAPAEAEIVAGVLTHCGEPGVRLFAGGENSNPLEVVWTATYRDMSVGGHRIYLEAVKFMAVPDGVVDLTTVTPVAGSPRPGVTKGERGAPGQDGQDGLTPYVGANGTWWVGDTDTGVRAQGPKGDPGDPGDGAGDGTGDVLWSDLNTVLDGKAPVSHDHTIAQVAGLQDELDGKSSSGHSHTVSSVTGLQDELDAKAAVSHQHSWADVTGKPDVYPPESHTHPSTDISDATATGRSVLTAESQAAARQAIGAGTSDLTLGTSSSTAARGDHSHTAAEVGAAPADHTHTPASIGAAPESHTHAQYAESSRVSALEDGQPIVVSSLPSSPLPGRIYLVTG